MATNIPIANGAVPILPASATVDAFRRQRVSNVQTEFDSKQIADAQPLFWDDAQTTGAGTSSTYNVNQASTTMAVSNVTAGTRVRQTFRSFDYKPGKSSLIFMTGVLGAGVAGIRRRMGQFNAQNGIFLQLSGSVLSFVIRSFTSGVAVDTVVNQASWNIDKLNGTGPSGITLDTTKAQLLLIDYEWLGAGSVRIGFFIQGELIYAHQFNAGNLLALVYMSSPNLPLRYEINNDGTGPVASLVHICVSVLNEGGEINSGGTNFAVSRDDTPLVTLNDNSLYPLIAIRLRSGYQFADIEAQFASIMCTSTASFRWMLLLNPTVVGVAFAFSTVPNSAIEADVARDNTTTVTGGTQIASGYAQAATTGETSIIAPSNLQIGASIAGVSDVLVLAAQRLSVLGSTTETFFASLAWRESK